MLAEKAMDEAAGDDWKRVAMNRGLWKSKMSPGHQGDNQCLSSEEGLSNMDS